MSALFFFLSVSFVHAFEERNALDVKEPSALRRDKAKEIIFLRIFPSCHLCIAIIVSGRSRDSFEGTFEMHSWLVLHEVDNSAISARELLEEVFTNLPLNFEQNSSRMTSG